MGTLLVPMNSEYRFNKSVFILNIVVGEFPDNTISAVHIKPYFKEMVHEQDRPI